MIIVSTQVILWLLFASAAASAFMIGKSITQNSQDLIIEKTIMYLVENNLVRWKKDENGEIELLRLDE
jgi:hypothetical protein